MSMRNSMVRDAATRLLTAANRPVAARRLSVLVERTPPPYRVELGSYRSRRDGWICTDVSWRSRHWLDATKPWPVPEASVSHVYGDNMIEHVTLDQARFLFGHAHRALVPGGRLRLVTPDAERFARMYLDGGDLLAAHVERNRRHGYRVDHRVSLLRTVFAEGGHHRGFVWDLDAMSAELDAAGFVRIARCEVGDSEDPALRDLETRTEPSDRALFLVVEATRP
jgi:predicted SAM-dependent methyltransferase